ncbi:hypothetical protein Tco_0389157 [Tanacetum coccineum]
MEDLSFYIFWVRRSLAGKVASGGGGGRNNSPEKMEGMEEEDDVCSRKDITPIAVHNIYSFYEFESSESESEDLNEIHIETLTLEQYLALNHNNSQVGVKRPGIEKNIVFEIKSQLLRELRENTFCGGKMEDSMEHEQPRDGGEELHPTYYKPGMN